MTSSKMTQGLRIAARARRAFAASALVRQGALRRPAQRCESPEVGQRAGSDKVAAQLGSALTIVSRAVNVVCVSLACLGCLPAAVAQSSQNHGAGKGLLDFLFDRAPSFK